ncbi:polysaccharide deacetylase family sporulation protein PdaB [Bacillus sp. 2205SS5-2]|uniref:polysaccharide deacetylase family sporulation protein PdaB n=1 Tax=Bacillus sp. 2205SS5-2 TaxID=3109031 RepID=UPI0030077FF4
MVRFYVWNAQRLKLLTLIIIISFFTAILLYSQSSSFLPVFSTKDGPKAVFKGEKGVALTFNIGWGDEKAKPILEELKRLEVKSATFFLSGSWAERHPDLTKEIQEAGYEIGILGYSYVDYTSLEKEEIRRDLSKATDVFNKLKVENIKLLRAPTGDFNKTVLAIADTLGYTLVHWSINSNDWTNPGTDIIVQNIQSASDGDILLFHASDSAKQTKPALPDVVSTLKNKGKLVTVSQLISNGDVQTKTVP